MAAVRLSVDITARLAEFEANLAKTPGITKREIKRAVKEMKVQLKEAEKASAEAAKASKKAWGESFNGIEQLSKRVTEKMGGNFALVGGIAIDGAKDISKILAPLGLAGTAVVGLGIGAAAAAVSVGLAVVGVVALAKGAVALADGAVAARDRLVEAGRASQVAFADRASLDAYVGATKELNLAVDEFVVHSGSGMANVLGVLAFEATKAVAKIDDSRESIMDLHFAIEVLSGRAVPEALSAAVVRPLVASEVAAYDAESAVRALIARTAEASAAASKLSNGTGFATFGPLQTDAHPLSERDAQEKESAEKRKQYHADLVAAVTAGNAEMASSAAAVRAADKANAQAAIAEVNELNAQHEQFTNAKAARDAQLLATEETARLDRKAKAEQDAEDAKARNAAVASTTLATAVQIADAMDTLFGALAEHAAEQLEEQQEANNALRSRNRDLTRDIMAARKAASHATTDAQKKEADGVVANLELEQIAVDAKIKLGEQKADKERKLAQRAFAAQKAAGIAAVAIQTAIAVMQAFASLPWPANAIAAAGVAVAGGVQAGVIAAQPVPEFPMGAVPSVGQSPDHPDIIAKQRHEGLLTGRGVDAIGGPSAVRRANEGRDSGGGMTAIVQIGRRTDAAADSHGRRVRVDPRAGKGPAGRG